MKQTSNIKKKNIIYISIYDSIRDGNSIVGTFEEKLMQFKHKFQYYRITQQDYLNDTSDKNCFFTWLKHKVSNTDQFKDFHVKFDLLPNMKWPLRFDSKFIQKWKQLEYWKYIYALIINFAKGYCISDQIHFPNQIKYLSFQKMKIDICKNYMIFNYGVEKVPITKNGQLIQFEYVHHIRFFDIVSYDLISRKNQKLIQTLELQYQNYLNDPYLTDLGDSLNEIELKTTIEQQLFYKQDCEYSNQSEIKQFQDQSVITFPTKFEPFYLTKQEQQSVIFDQQMQRWISTDQSINAERNILDEYQRKANQEILEKYADFGSAAKLVELLEKIPEFQVQLTSQEKDVIGTQGNVLVIGRSGTGKTTSAIMRMFSIEMLFKIRTSLYKNKIDKLLSSTRFTSDDIEQTVGLHCMFVTASPILLAEIQRYYKQMTDNLKNQIQKKQEKLRNQQKQNAEVDEEEDEMILAEKISKTQLDEQVLTEKKIDSEQLENELKEDEQLLANIKKYSNLNQIRENEFPCFQIFRNLLIMVDGCVKNPFFSRNKQGEIIGSDSQAQWHEDANCIMMINKQKDQTEEELQLNDDDAVKSDSSYSDEEDIEREYERQMALQNRKLKEKNSTKIFLGKGYGFEVDYDYFEKFFWDIELKSRNFPNHSPALIWREIFSIIKGHSESYQYPAGYIPFNRYKDICDHNMMLKEYDLWDIYSLFGKYEKWKQKIGGYDMMDVVNHELRQIDKNNYYGQPIHYLMVDEVQDLPHAAVLLLMKITEQGVFFSGDTAQNISKGVGNRFCELVQLFSSNNFRYGQYGSPYLKKPFLKQLTTNFRSHSKILQLANSIVSLIEIFFPSTIDKLQKEISNLDGPKPQIIDGDEEVLFMILSGESADEKRCKALPVEFGCNQVIIVRSEQDKEKIPETLKHALCLTVLEAKGLEFEDVILFNFFDNNCLQQWGIMNSIEIKEMQVTEEEMSQRVTMHENGTDDVSLLFENIYDIKTKTYHVQEVHAKQIKSLNIQKYVVLCQELKMLYTAITRPRNRLIIYEKNPVKNHLLIRYWESLNLVQLLDSSNFQSDKQLNHMKQTILKKTSKQEWKVQGMIKLIKIANFYLCLMARAKSRGLDCLKIFLLAKGL